MLVIQEQLYARMDSQKYYLEIINQKGLMNVTVSNLVVQQLQGHLQKQVIICLVH